MITKEMLTALEELKGLTDDQIKAIITLSENDENKVIAEKTREFWTRLDEDIKTVTGKEKPATVKTYDFFKGVLKDLQKQAEEVEQAVKAKTKELQTELEDLRKKVKDGAGDDAMKAQIQKLETELKTHETRAKKLERDLKAKEKEAQELVQQKEKEMMDLRVGSVISQAVSGLKFKEGIPKEVIPTLIEKAKEEILAKGLPEFTDDGKDFILRDPETQLPILNADNYQKPFTGTELLLSSLKPVLADGAGSAGGAGTKGGGAGGNGVLGIQAKTQLEASAIIAQHLKEKGVQQGTKEYQEQWDKIVEENKILDLPVK